MDNPNLNVFFAITKNYTPRILELIFSLRKHSKKHLNCYIMIDDDNINYYHDILEKVSFNDTEITIIPSTELDKHFNLNYRTSLSKMTYARLLIFKMFKHLDRMLYLDADVLIKNDGIDALYDSDFNGKYAFVIEELSMELFNKTEMNDCGVKRYFNAGVLMLNISKIIEDHIDDTCIDLLQHPKEFLINRGYSDQSILNIAFHENVYFVNPKYNSLIIMAGYPQYDEYCRKFGYKDQMDMYQNCVVSHMMGAKPWEPRWHTWQSWQIPYKQWQKDLFEQNKQEFIEKNISINEKYKNEWIEITESNIKYFNDNEDISRINDILENDKTFDYVCIHSSNDMCNLVEKNNDLIDKHNIFCKKNNNSISKNVIDYLSKTTLAYKTYNKSLNSIFIDYLKDNETSIYTDFVIHRDNAIQLCNFILDIINNIIGKIDKNEAIKQLTAFWLWMNITNKSLTVKMK